MREVKRDGEREGVIDRERGIKYINDKSVYDFVF